MSDFYQSRLAAVYTPTDNDALPLVEYGQLMPEVPERSWELVTASHELVGAAYAVDLPNGNARMTLTLTAMVGAPTVAELERRLWRLEVALNTQRSGSLRLAQAYHEGTPTLLTDWVAVVTEASTHRCTLDEAPGLAGAWGVLSVTFSLTNPTEV